MQAALERGDGTSGGLLRNRRAFSSLANLLAQHGKIFTVYIVDSLCMYAPLSPPRHPHNDASSGPYFRTPPRSASRSVSSSPSSRAAHATHVRGYGYKRPVWDTSLAGSLPLATGLLPLGSLARASVAAVWSVSRTVIVEILTAYPAIDHVGAIDKGRGASAGAARDGRAGQAAIGRVVAVVEDSHRIVSELVTYVSRLLL